jgi:hypothetical protein
MEEDLRPIRSRGWAEMIRNVYEVDPMNIFLDSFFAWAERVCRICRTLERPGGFVAGQAHSLT